MRGWFLKTMALICAVSLALVAVCAGEGEYDPASENYLHVESEAPDAAEFAEVMAETNMNFYQQIGIKSVLYVLDTFGGASPSEYADTVAESRGEASDEIIMVCALKDEAYAFRLPENLTAYCSADDLEKIYGDVAANEQFETFYQEFVAAYTGVMMRVYMGTQTPKSTATPEPTTTPEPQPTREPTRVYNQDGIRIYYRGMSLSSQPIGGLTMTIDLLIVNGSDQSISLSADEAYINGYKVWNATTEVVAAGKSMDAKLNFYNIKEDAHLGAGSSVTSVEIGYKVLNQYYMPIGESHLNFN